MKHMSLLGLALTLLSFCLVRATPLNLRYVVTTPQEGIVQQTRVLKANSPFRTVKPQA